MTMVELGIESAPTMEIDMNADTMSAIKAATGIGGSEIEMELRPEIVSAGPEGRIEAEVGAASPRGTGDAIARRSLVTSTGPNRCLFQASLAIAQTAKIRQGPMLDYVDEWIVA